MTLLDKFEDVENHLADYDNQEDRPEEEKTEDKSACNTFKQTCGTTAITTLITPTHIISCNTGDSRFNLWACATEVNPTHRVILAREGASRPLSHDHKPYHDKVFSQACHFS